MTTRIGDTISHYRILARLGEGGMGVVYKAEDLKLKRIVAIKVLSDETATAGEARKRFVREAQSASSLNHPAICVIHEIDERDGEMFIVMEYLAGETLRTWITDRGAGQGARGRPKALDILLQIADGLERAHQAGIVHRDIKPENIMILPDGRAKIMDFGLAKLEGASVLTRDKSTVGTVAYMAPEQLQGGRVDSRADVYSLGVVAYEMLSARRPIEADSMPALMYAVVHQEPPPLRSLVPGITPALNDIVMRCLAKDPAKRPRSMLELSGALAKCNGSSTVTASTLVAGGARRPIAGRASSLARNLLLAVGASGILIASWVVFRPAPSPDKVQLTIDGKPDSVTVAIDGKVVGMTPLVEYDAVPGRVVLSFSRQAYRRRDTVLEVSSGSHVRVSFVLLPQVQAEQLHSSPAILNPASVPTSTASPVTPPATGAQPETPLTARSLEELVVLLAGRLERVPLSSSESIVVLPFTYRDTQIGGQVSRTLKTLIENHLVEKSGWSIVQPEVTAGVLPQGLVSSRGPSPTHAITGVYWESAAGINFVASLERLSDRKLLASSLVAVDRSVIRTSRLELKPSNFDHAMKEEKMFEQGEVRSDSLRLDIWTNKGRENLIFSRNESMELYVRASIPCRLRVIYDMASGQRALLADNESYSGDSAKGDRTKKVFSFTCEPPFGVETVHVFARTEKFDPIKTVTDGDNIIVAEDLKDFLFSTRGMKRAEPGIQQTEARLILTTIDDNSHH